MNMEECATAIRFFERRKKIIKHNNNCIVEIIIFYENFFLNYIIEPFLFNENYFTNKEISNFIKNRLTFMDSFKIVCKIAKSKGIKSFKKIDNLIEMRNEIAHNLSGVGIHNITDKTHQIFIGGKEYTWNGYIEKLKTWAQLSVELANFTRDVYAAINTHQQSAYFHYCTVEGNCILIKNNLFFPEPEGKYQSFVEEGITEDLRQFIIEEMEYKKQM